MSRACGGDGDIDDDKDYKENLNIFKRNMFKMRRRMI